MLRILTQSFAFLLVATLVSTVSAQGFTLNPFVKKEPEPDSIKRTISDTPPPSESTSQQPNDLVAPEPNMREPEAPSDVATAGSLTPEQTAVLKDHLDENVAKPMEQSMLIVMVGGTLAAAAFVFIVSLFIRRAV